MQALSEQLRIDMKEPIEDHISYETLELFRMLRKEGETSNECLMRLILHYAMTDPSMPPICLSDKGKKMLYGKPDTS